MWLLLAEPWVCQLFVIVVFPDHTIFMILLVMVGTLYALSV